MEQVTDLYDIRRKHLEKQICDHYKNISEFCKKTGEDYAAVHRYINGKMNIGNKVVRRFEQVFNLPQGSFDNDIKEGNIVKIPIFNTQDFKEKLIDTLESKPVRFHYISTREIITEIGCQHTDLIGVFIDNDAMHPVLRVGCNVLINMRALKIIDGHIYAILINGVLFIRRVLFTARPNVIVIVPENKSKFEKEEVDLNNCKIIGKIVYIMGEL